MTRVEKQPGWQVDLERDCRIDRVVVEGCRVKIALRGEGSLNLAEVIVEGAAR